MTLEELLQEYALSQSSPESSLLKEVQRAAHIRLLQPRMVCGHQQGLLLRMLTKLISPKYVLELGAYSGYSTIAIAEALEKEDAQIHSIENNDELAPFLDHYIAKTSAPHKIVMHYGKALDIIPQLVSKYPFQLVYMDADKREYPLYYDALIDLLPQGALIIADNTLWSGKVVSPTPLGKDKQLDGILEFNSKVKNDSRVEQLLLPIRDGFTMIRKI